MLNETIITTGLTCRNTPIAKIDALVAATLGPTRVSGNAQPSALYRHMAMYLCRHVGGWSLSAIGRYYNGRDHSTVHYALRKIAALRQVDPEVDSVLRRLTVTMRSGEAAGISTAGPAVTARPQPVIQISESLIELLADRVAERLAARSTAPG